MKSFAKPVLMFNGDSHTYLKKQALNLLVGLVVAFFVSRFDYRLLRAYTPILWGASILGLIVVLSPLGKTLNGAHAWILLPGGLSIQPAEFAKFATNMALAKYLSTLGIQMQHLRTKVISFLLIGVPTGIILLQNDTGSAMVFASFVFVLYREGLSGNVLLLGFLAVVLFVLALVLMALLIHKRDAFTVAGAHGATRRALAWAAS